MKRTLRYGGARSRPIGVVGLSLKSTKVDIEILLARGSFKGDDERVTGSGIGAKETERRRAGQ